MRPIKQWVTHYHQTILSLSANMLKKQVFGSFNLNNSELFRLSFDDIFLGTLDTNTKTMYPPSAVLGGGGGGGAIKIIVLRKKICILELQSTFIDVYCLRLCTHRISRIERKLNMLDQ